MRQQNAGWLRWTAELVVHTSRPGFSAGEMQGLQWAEGQTERCEVTADTAGDDVGKQEVY